MWIIYIGKGCIYFPFLIKHPQPLRSYLDSARIYRGLSHLQKPSSCTRLIRRRSTPFSHSHIPNHHNLLKCQKTFARQGMRWFQERSESNQTNEKIFPRCDRNRNESKSLRNGKSKLHASVSSSENLMAGISTYANKSETICS